MARPKKVNPNGNTRMVSVLVAEETYHQLKSESVARSLSFGDLLREKLQPTKVTG